MLKLWNWIKTYLFKFLGGLFMDEKAGAQVISLGRVMLIIVFAVMLHCWHQDKAELPAGLMEAFIAMLGYVFGSKAVQTTQAWLAKGSSDSPRTPEA
jgi:hypothetical protein